MVEPEVQLSVMFVSVERGAVLVTPGRPQRERERGGTVTGPASLSWNTMGQAALQGLVVTV